MLEARPIVVNPDMIVLGGNMRLKACKAAGLQEAPVYVASWEESKAKEFIVKDNVGFGEWDWDILANEWDAVELEEWGLDVWTPEEEPTEGLTDPDEVPEVPEEPTTKPGDLWILGDHRLLCGDSTKSEDVEKLMNGEKARLCFTSPPYADQREYNGGKNLSTEYIATFIRAAHQRCDLFAVNLGLSRKGGEVNAYWDDYIKEARSCGLKFLSWNVWHKGVQGSIGQLTAMFPIAHEWIFIFGDKRKDLNRTIPNKRAGQIQTVGNRQADGSIKVKKGVTTNDRRAIGTVIEMSGEQSREWSASHPAMFPVAFPESYIMACTNDGQGVYDPFTGSGSTLIAADKTNRKFYGMELDPKYCDVIVKRWEDFTGKKAQLWKP